MEAEDERAPPSREELLALVKSEVKKGGTDPSLETTELDEVSRDAVRRLHNCDINLSRRNLRELGEELIDEMKDVVTRLALHRNHLTGLSGLGPRIQECTMLKYLVLRNNDIREFPRDILGLQNLERLDLRNNKIPEIPEDISTLPNLRILSASRNRITKIPLSLASMRTIHTLDLIINPIVFPPQNEWSLENQEDRDNKSKTPDQPSQRRRAAETAKIMQALRGHLSQRKTKKVTVDEGQSESNADTPRPARRKTSGRLPVRPSVSSIGLEALSHSRTTSPMPTRPPMPSKSFTSLATQTLASESSNDTIRPGPAPLVNSNERNRSNSESVMPTSMRNKRRGMITKDRNLSQHLMTEQDPTNLKHLSHMRDASYGTAPQSGLSTTMTDSSGQTSPVEGETLRPSLGKRLSSLHEGKRKSQVSDTTIAGLRRLQGTTLQISDVFKEIVDFCASRGLRFEDWDRAIFKTRLASKALRDEIRIVDRQDDIGEEDEWLEAVGNLRRQCDDLYCDFQHSFTHINQSMMREIVRLCQGHNNQELLQRFAMMLQHASNQMGNGLLQLPNIEIQMVPAGPPRDCFYAEDILPKQGQRSQGNQHQRQEPHREHRRQDPRLPDPYNIGHSRDGSRYDQPHQAEQGPFGSSTRRSESTVSFASPPAAYSVGSFTSRYRSQAPNARGNESWDTMQESLEGEDRLLQDVWAKINDACDLVMNILPKTLDTMDDAFAHMEIETAEEHNCIFVEACEGGETLLEIAQSLKSRLTSFKISIHHAKNQSAFWEHCKALLTAFIALVDQLRMVEDTPYKRVCNAIKRDLKSVKNVVRTAGDAIQRSPWESMARIGSPARNGQMPSFIPSHERMDVPMQRTAQVPNFIPPDQRMDDESVDLPTHDYSRTAHRYQQSRVTQPSISQTPRTQPSLTLQTQGSIPAINPSDPTSAVSSVGNVSSGGAPSSGLQTPLNPSTPMSAALGPSAQAVVPAGSGPTLPDLPAGATAGSSFGSVSSMESVTMERSRSISQRRIGGGQPRGSSATQGEVLETTQEKE